MTVDREEIIVVLAIADVELAATPRRPGRRGARRSRPGFREETREHRIEIAREAEHRFDRKVAWGFAHRRARGTLTHVAAPVMTRLRQPERRCSTPWSMPGSPRSRADALAWCVRLVGEHAEAWLADLREAMQHGRRRPQQGAGGLTCGGRRGAVGCRW